MVTEEERVISEGSETAKGAGRVAGGVGGEGEVREGGR